MDRTFMNCKSLNEIDLSSFNTPRLLFLTETFKGCNLLTSIDLSNFNILKLKGITELFSGCHKLQYINLSNIQFNKVIKIENIFNDLPDNINLKIDSSLYEKMKEQIPFKWKVSKN